MAEPLSTPNADRRYEDEREFHNRAFSEDVRKDAEKYYSVADNSRRLYHEYLLAHSAGKTVLEYGCGPGSAAFARVASGKAKP